MLKLGCTSEILKLIWYFIRFALTLCLNFEGWIIAMQQMHIGDKWEIYIPAEMGYGKFSQPGIPGGSTLIFEIELLGIA